MFAESGSRPWYTHAGPNENAALQISRVSALESQDHRAVHSDIVHVSTYVPPGAAAKALGITIKVLHDHFRPSCSHVTNRFARSDKLSRLTGIEVHTLKTLREDIW